ncbi:MAG TPA: FtsH protease activity modulator HflK [Acidobacteriota bacterium]
MHDEHHDHGHQHGHMHPRVKHSHFRRLAESLARLKSQPRWLVGGLLVIYLLSGLFYVPADQQAVRVRFGKLMRQRVQPGLHYAWPFPAERVIRLKVNEAQRLAIGSTDLSRALGVGAATPDEYLLTGDQNLVRLQAWIQYYIQDPAGYLYRSESLPSILEGLFFQCMSRAVASRKVDDILTVERIALQNEVQQALQESGETLGLGITITSVALEQVSPPEEVRDAFLEVANSREDRNRIVQEANGYANELLPRARGSAQELMQQSEIYRNELENRARGESDRFTTLWQEYRDHRRVTTARLFLEAMEDILPRIRKVILDDSGKAQGLDLDILEVQKK